MQPLCELWLTHWGLEMHICVGELTTIGPENGMAPSRRQAIIILSKPMLEYCWLATKYSEILIKNYILSFKKVHLKIASAKWRPICLGQHTIRLEGPYVVASSSDTTLPHYILVDHLILLSKGCRVNMVECLVFRRESISAFASTIFSHGVLNKIEGIPEAHTYWKIPFTNIN